MTPWGEKPGGFSGMGGYGGDSAWLGNAKRQSLFRAGPGPISWAGKPNTPGMMSQQPVSNQQSGQPVPMQQPPSLFSAPTNAFGMTADQSRAQASDWGSHEREMAEARRESDMYLRQSQARDRAMFASDTRTYQGRRLPDIFGGGFSGLPGTGSY